jgi:capsular polysaccharide biosynthesis protein
MKSEMTIEQIFRVLWKRLPLIVLLACLGGVLSGVYSWQYLSNVYQTNSMVMVSSTKNSTISTVSTDQQLDASDYYLNLQLVNSYSVLCKTNRVLDQVISELGLPMTAAQLSSMISVTSVKDTEIINIYVTGGDPALTQSICNTLTTVFQKEVISIMKMDNVQVIDTASLPTYPISPNRERNVLIGVLLGIVLGAVLGLALEFLDRTVRTEEQIQTIMGVPVLGTVPRIKGKK